MLSHRSYFIAVNFAQGNIKDDASSSVASELDRIEEMENDEFERTLSDIRVPAGQAKAGKRLHTIEEPSKIRRDLGEEEEDDDGREGNVVVFDSMA